MRVLELKNKNTLTNFHTIELKIMKIFRVIDFKKALKSFDPLDPKAKGFSYRMLVPGMRIFNSTFFVHFSQDERTGGRCE